MVYAAQDRIFAVVHLFAPLLLTSELMWLTQQMEQCRANRPESPGGQETLQKLASYLCFAVHNAPDAAANG